MGGWLSLAECSSTPHCAYDAVGEVCFEVPYRECSRFGLAIHQPSSMLMGLVVVYLVWASLVVAYLRGGGCRWWGGLGLLRLVGVGGGSFGCRWWGGLLYGFASFWAGVWFLWAVELGGLHSLLQGLCS
ncbi:hypothetical protein U1Q18_044561 [Sarracenia purpurea var. burkii]